MGGPRYGAETEDSPCKVSKGTSILAGIGTTKEKEEEGIRIVYHDRKKMDYEALHLKGLE